MSTTTTLLRHLSDDSQIVIRKLSPLDIAIDDHVAEDLSLTRNTPLIHAILRQRISASSLTIPDNLINDILAINQQPAPDPLPSLNIPPAMNKTKTEV